jgi:cephalosporin hydroxylase
MNPIEEFEQSRSINISNLGKDAVVHDSAISFMLDSAPHKYTYNYSWLGRPIIQYPQDIMAMQEIIWTVQPDLIIETGIAHGGSLIFSASMLELNAACGGCPDAEVLGIDIDIRQHNREEIEAHPLHKRISMIEGSSIAPDVIKQVKAKAQGKQKILICLDSNHTHDHVLAELEAYAPLTSIGSYCVVFDTVIEDLPDDMFSDRPWGVGNNPKTAVWEYLKTHPEFEIDKSIQHKLLITVAPDGYLKRIA